MTRQRRHTVLQGGNRVYRNGPLPELCVLYLRDADRLARNGDARRLVAASEALHSKLTLSLPSRDRAVYLLNKATAQEDFIKAQIDELISLRARVTSASVLLRPFLTIRLMRRLEALLDYLDAYKTTMADRQITETAREPMPYWLRVARCAAFCAD
jgi:hypothetical protein